MTMANRRWQVQEAKQRFSELVDRALADGPQVVTRRGKAVVVVVDIDEFERRDGSGELFKQWLVDGPVDDGFADIVDTIVADRNLSQPRDVPFES